MLVELEGGYFSRVVSSVQIHNVSDGIMMASDGRMIIHGAAL
jgi:hypothetical protein